jgi:hypothetical protein
MLRSYKERMLHPPGSDAEYIDDDVYGSEPDPSMELDPRGLVDRLSQEQMTGQLRRRPGIQIPQQLPTTRNSY